MTPDEKNVALSRALEKVTPDILETFGVSKIVIVVSDGTRTFCSSNNATETADVFRMFKSVMRGLAKKFN
jgi:hypothetical protein